MQNQRASNSAIMMEDHDRMSNSDSKRRNFIQQLERLSRDATQESEPEISTAMRLDFLRSEESSEELPERGGSLRTPKRPNTLCAYHTTDLPPLPGRLRYGQVFS